MEPVPYEIREDDVDEVLNAHEPTGGGRFPEEQRVEIRRHVLLHVTELDEMIRTAPETDLPEALNRADLTAGVGPVSERPGEQSESRRELALGAIEDLLIREGFLELYVDEARTFPVIPFRDTERDDA
jgi:hypothetical protein